MYFMNQITLMGMAKQKSSFGAAMQEYLGGQIK
jgi:hypothetical protein